MVRVGLTAAIGLLLAMPAAAGAWAEQFFAERAHDFGSVVRGPTITHSYRITNTSATPLHIAGVRVSCGCTTATANSAEIAPGQSTEIVAQMDTRRFIGPKTVTIYVQFDRPQWDEVRLTISANGRDDLAIVPDSLAFGSVAHGSAPSRTSTVTFLGSSVHLVSVQADSNYVQLAAKGIRNTGSELVYEVVATLRPDTPVGRWYTDIWLNTDNPSAPRLRLPLSVDIAPALRLSSPVLSFGAVKPGDSAEKRVMVQSAHPFRIIRIEGTDESVSVVSGAAEPKPVQLLVVGIKATQHGEMSRRLKIVTDLPADNIVELPIHATIALPHVD
jgi:hypothetical protein